MDRQAEIPIRNALRLAQIELHCDHDREALMAARCARRALLEAGPDDGNLLMAVEEAVFFLKRHDAVHARDALDRAHTALLH
jgi:hypothetical protein